MHAFQGDSAGAARTTLDITPDPAQYWKTRCKQALKKPTPGRVHRLRQTCRQIEAVLLLDGIERLSVKRKRGLKLARVLLKKSNALRDLDTVTRILRKEGVEIRQRRRRKKYAAKAHATLLDLAPRVSKWVRRWRKTREGNPAESPVPHYPLEKIHRDIDRLVAQLRQDLERFSPRAPESFEPVHRDRVLLKRRYYQLLLCPAQALVRDGEAARRERRLQDVKNLLSLTGRIHDRLTVGQRLPKMALSSADRLRIQVKNAAVIDALTEELRGRLLEPPSFTAPAARLRVVS
ncbi:MAG: hypothetical protein KGJ12_03050 [Gammaproteobacteria bacterium]|nr:hypothetical protein [Gammaproteobacteria bacterium]